MPLNGILHVYGASGPQDAPMIVGSRAALEALREAIGQALETGYGQATARTANGEGFAVHIAHLPDPLFESLVPPYDDGESDGVVTKNDILCSLSDVRESHRRETALGHLLKIWARDGLS